jgi:hypothetical protein
LATKKRVICLWFNAWLRGKRFAAPIRCCLASHSGDRNLAKLKPLIRKAPGFCGLALLAACAAPAPRIAPAPMQQAAAPTGVIVPGVVAAIRPVTAQETASPGTAEVLAALQVAAPAAAPGANEYVIQRSDGNVAAIVLPAPAASPDAALSSADFSVGDPVDLVTGDATELIHRNP